MMDEDDNIESLVTARSAGTENMEPGEYQAYVKTQIAKAMGFKEDTTNKAELSLVDSYYEMQLAVVNKQYTSLESNVAIQLKI
jgi:hypothetical protein